VDLTWLGHAVLQGHNCGCTGAEGTAPLQQNCWGLGPMPQWTRRMGGLVHHPPSGQGWAASPCCFGRPQQLEVLFLQQLLLGTKVGTAAGLDTVPPSHIPRPASGAKLALLVLSRHLGWHQLFSQQQWHRSHCPHSAGAALTPSFSTPLLPLARLQ